MLYHFPNMKKISLRAHRIPFALGPLKHQSRPCSRPCTPPPPVPCAMPPWNLQVCSFITPMAIYRSCYIFNIHRLKKLLSAAGLFYYHIWLISARLRAVLIIYWANQVVCSLKTGQIDQCALSARMPLSARRRACWLPVGRGPCGSPRRPPRLSTCPGLTSPCLFCLLSFFLFFAFSLLFVFISSYFCFLSIILWYYFV